MTLPEHAADQVEHWRLIYLTAKWNMKTILLCNEITSNKNISRYLFIVINCYDHCNKVVSNSYPIWTGITWILVIYDTIYISVSCLYLLTYNKLIVNQFSYVKCYWYNAWLYVFTVAFQWNYFRISNGEFCFRQRKEKGRTYFANQIYKLD